MGDVRHNVSGTKNMDLPRSLNKQSAHYRFKGQQPASTARTDGRWRCDWMPEKETPGSPLREQTTTHATRVAHGRHSFRFCPPSQSVGPPHLVHCRLLQKFCERFPTGMFFFLPLFPKK